MLGHRWPTSFLGRHTTSVGAPTPPLGDSVVDVADEARRSWGVSMGLNHSSNTCLKEVLYGDNIPTLVALSSCIRANYQAYCDSGEKNVLRRSTEPQNSATRRRHTSVG